MHDRLYIVLGGRTSCVRTSPLAIESCKGLCVIFLLILKRRRRRKKERPAQHSSTAYIALCCGREMNAKRLVGVVQQRRRRHPAESTWTSSSSSWRTSAEFTPGENLIKSSIAIGQHCPRIPFFSSSSFCSYESSPIRTGLDNPIRPRRSAPTCVILSWQLLLSYSV